MLFDIFVPLLTNDTALINWGSLYHLRKCEKSEALIQPNYLWWKEGTEEILKVTINARTNCIQKIANYIFSPFFILSQLKLEATRNIFDLSIQNMESFYVESGVDFYNPDDYEASKSRDDDSSHGHDRKYPRPREYDAESANEYNGKEYFDNRTASVSSESYDDKGDSGKKPSLVRFFVLWACLAITLGVAVGAASGLLIVGDSKTAPKNENASLPSGMNAEASVSKGSEDKQVDSDTDDGLDPTSTPNGKFRLLLFGRVSNSTAHTI